MAMHSNLMLTLNLIRIILYSIFGCFIRSFVHRNSFAYNEIFLHQFSAKQKSSIRNELAFKNINIHFYQCLWSCTADSPFQSRMLIIFITFLTIIFTFFPALICDSSMTDRSFYFDWKKKILR